MQGGAVARMQYAFFFLFWIEGLYVQTKRKRSFSSYMSNTHSTPSTPWLAASHLASGCSKTRKTSIFRQCNIHQKRKKSNAVPVQAVPVSVVNNCKM